MTPSGEVWLTYRGAAIRAGRSERTIKRWVKAGMEAGWDAEGRRIVAEPVLLAEKRRRLDAWPPHQYRMRRLHRDTPEQFWS